MITSKDKKEPLKTQNNSEKINNQNNQKNKIQQNRNIDYTRKKAEAVKMYVNENKNLREVEKETGVSKSTISREVIKEFGNNREFYQETLEVNRYNISYLSKLLKENISKINVKELDDLVKISDISLKQQKLVSLIEGATQSQNNNLPGNINIQIINK